MVQQFLQTQLKIQPSQTRRGLSMTIARGFGRRQTTARNIVRWETLWVDKRNIPERKERQDYFSWIFHGWMMKDLRSQSGILLEDKVILSVLCKSENTGRSLVTNKY